MVRYEEAPVVDRRDGPLATLEAAREVIRSMGDLPKADIVVHIMDGTYTFTSGLTLDEQDSGSLDARITYEGSGASPCLVGGRRVDGFEAVDDVEVLRRLSRRARSHVLQLDLIEEGIKDFGSLTSRGFGRGTRPSHLELFFQGRRMELARWPNQGFVRITAPAEDLPDGDGHGGPLGRMEAGFIYDGHRPARWRKMDDVWVHGYWTWDWANTYERVESIDLQTGHIRTAPPYGVYGIKAGQRFYFLNVLEELDTPGEYYLDREKGMIYFWPPGDLAREEAVVTLLEEPLIRLKGVRRVSLRGLTLEYSRGSGIEILGGSAVEVVGCRIRNLGNGGVVVKGGLEHRVISCDLSNLGDAGIHVTGGDRKSLTPSGHVVENNHIHHMGQWSRTYQPGIMAGGVGVRVAHNLIHDGPHSAILLSGNEHKIEYNHIHHVCQETGDVGAIYLGRDWTQRGNVVRHNFFHHTLGVGFGSMAVYLDDCASGTTVFANVFYKCTRAVFIGGGRDNLVENNIFMECDPAVMMDGRGLDPNPVWHNMVYSTMRKLLCEADHHRPPYSERYPELGQLDRHYEDDKGVPPEGNRVVRNISLGGKWLEIHWHADPRMIVLQDNFVGEDPGFMDAENMDFRLEEDSPVYELGFRPIPIERIGLYEDGLRSSEGQ